MIEFTVPGVGQFSLDNLVLDMNGTITTDGILIPGMKWRIQRLREALDIYLLTADTFGTAARVAGELNISLRIVDPSRGAADKRQLVAGLGADRTIAIGNGYNDREMLAEAGLSMAVIGAEGCSGEALRQARLVVRDIRDGLDLLLDRRRLIATLRA